MWHFADMIETAYQALPPQFPAGVSLFAPVAQWIEQQIPNLCAACPIHAGGTN